MTWTPPDDGRDFLGYGEQPPVVAWPGAARVAVSIVLNIEEGAELAVSSGDERNEAVHELVDPPIEDRALGMESHFEYGSRAGYWRIMRVLDGFHVPVTLNVCARALVRTPWVGTRAMARGDEIMCHGWRWETHLGMGPDDERAVIARSVAAIRDVTGERPVGWHVKSNPSANTRRLLLEEGGFLYDSNLYNDDLPVTLHTGPRPYVLLPYAFDTNDMNFHVGNRFVHADDFARYCCDAYDWLFEEGAAVPRMMTIGLHTRIIGRPGRIAGLERFLAHVTRKGGAWFARRDAIARAWLDAGL
ncbi:polysaccharide deacetylase family protein [Marinivivus vitaminiproducens]|uniref:polysaccharide deacetylase family protein n=1 Tax=Marinivivus vitaminiproducens TaxID=3035935 RepID=UPI0027A57BBC|nr:polysaccharide deacetylase family protein [Geminicoccaceae bacterium SCSIO 64248]